MSTAVATKPKPQPLMELLYSKTDSVEEVLPKQLRGESRRLAKRYALYVENSIDPPKGHLKECTNLSHVMALIQAAEFGLPIDGHLAHSIPYKNGKTGKYEAKFQPDYKGLIAVGRRNGAFEDIWARLVYEGDKFEIGEKSGQPWYDYQPRFQSDQVVAVFAVCRHSEDWFRWEVMRADEIEGIRKRSQAANNGPWVTDWGEMAKKTVIRRLLKTFHDDPGLSQLIQLDEEEYQRPEPPRVPAAKSLAEVTERLTGPPNKNDDKPMDLSGIRKLMAKAKTLEELQECRTAEEPDIQLKFGPKGVDALNALYDEFAGKKLQE